MRLHTLENLVDKLDEDFTWRIKELTTINANIQISLKNSNTGNLSFYLRSGVALLYAHWEGFIKNAAQFYVLHISSQRLPYENLKNCFIALGLHGKLSEFQNNGSIKQKIFIVDFLFSQIGEVATIDEKIIKNHSNLNSDVLSEIIASLNLDKALFELKANLIDGQLLKGRNKIAHGDIYNFTSETESFDQLYNAVVAMMTDFKNQIILKAESKNYLKDI